MVTRKFASDDANLNVGSIITSRKLAYKDIDLDFSVNTNTGDIFKKKDANAVKEAIKNLLQTNFFERPYQPFLGSGIQDMLFELADEFTNDRLKDDIKQSINNFEPRARILNIEVTSNPDSNTIDVTIHFRVISTQQDVSFAFNLERLR